MTNNLKVGKNMAEKLTCNWRGTQALSSPGKHKSITGFLTSEVGTVSGIL